MSETPQPPIDPPIDPRIVIEAGPGRPAQGLLYRPPGSGPFPGVLLLHGSEGGWAGWNDQRATLLAAHGFAAYAFRYSRSGNPWNAGDLLEVPLEETAAALERLRALSLVGPRVALYGLSRGAEQAALLTSLLAAEGAPLPDALAVHSPADVVVGAFRAGYRRPPPDHEVWDPAALAWTWEEGGARLLPGTPIELERYAGPVFMSVGLADAMWTAEMTRRLEARLRAAGRTPEVHYYEGENHLLGPAAETRNWGRLIEFLTRHLAAS